MRILVTGATGNVGRSVVTALRDRGGAAICAAVSDPARADSLGSDVEPRMLDFRDPATFAAAAAGCDAVFLLRPPPISDMKRTLNPGDSLVPSQITSGTMSRCFADIPTLPGDCVKPRRRAAIEAACMS